MCDSCEKTLFGCCIDLVNAAAGPNFDGCKGETTFLLTENPNVKSRLTFLFILDDEDGSGDGFIDCSTTVMF